MIVNICCSGSSGSTFLSHLLNRHPDLACGDELGLFSKPVVYNNFDYLKKKSFWIKNFGISSNPYFEDASILRNLRSYKLSKNTVWSWVKESRNICDLTEKFNHHILNMTGKKVWAEKTPENICLIGHFIKMFPNAKIIHIVRDPRDVIMSMMRRGETIECATENWLVLVSAIQNYRSHPNVLEIKYEDLILNKELTLKDICKHLSVDFDIDYFVRTNCQSKGLLKNDKWDSWNLSPDQEGSDKSINKYKNSDIDFHPIFTMKLTKEYAALLGVDEYSLINLARSYNYLLPDKSLTECKNRITHCKKTSAFRKYVGSRARNCLIKNERTFPKTVY